MGHRVVVVTEVKGTRSGPIKRFVEPLASGPLLIAPRRQRPLQGPVSRGKGVAISATA